MEIKQIILRDLNGAETIAHRYEHNGDCIAERYVLRHRCLRGIYVCARVVLSQYESERAGITEEGIPIFTLCKKHEAQVSCFLTLNRDVALAFASAHPRA